MLLNDVEIRKFCTVETYHYGRPMIEPFSEAVSGDGVISYGLSHAGYDLRLGPQVLVFKNTYGETINPKKFGDPEYRKMMFDEVHLEPHQPVIIPANNYILGHTLEYLRIPNNLKARVVGKSTLARSGVLINTTPLEPGWEGHLTLEIANLTGCNLMIFGWEGCCQMEVEMLVEPPEKTYAGKKYDKQTGVTPAKVL